MAYVESNDHMTNGVKWLERYSLPRKVKSWPQYA